MNVYYVDTWLQSPVLLVCYNAMELAKHFSGVAKVLEENEESIMNDMLSCQGNPVDVGGYYMPCPERALTAMRPSDTFNAIIDGILATA